MAIYGKISVMEGNIRHMNRDTEIFLMQTSIYLLLKKSVPVMKSSVCLNTRKEFLYIASE
jgi:hypothetical protein